MNPPTPWGVPAATKRGTVTVKSEVGNAESHAARE